MVHFRQMLSFSMALKVMTVFATISAEGGGAGGNWNHTQGSNDGGSGGGGKNYAGLATAGQGFNGGLYGSTYRGWRRRCR